MSDIGPGSEVGCEVRFLRREKTAHEVGYPLHPPYLEARRSLLTRPAPETASRPAAGAGLWAVVVDLGLSDYLATIYAFADGTISIYASGGVHSTGLRGAPPVAEAAALLLEETAAAVHALPPAEAAACPLPLQGSIQVIARTYDGDRAATDRLPTRREPLLGLSAIALQLLELASQAAVDGFEPAEPGEVVYHLDREYWSMRRTLLDWTPRPDGPGVVARLAGVAVEYAEGEAVTSLFAFADGTASLYRSDGGVAEGMSHLAGVAEAVRRLLETIEASVADLEPVEMVRLPQPGHVQFLARYRSAEAREHVRLGALASAAELATGEHPLSAAFERANELRGIAHAGRTGGEADRPPPESADDLPARSQR